MKSISVISILWRMKRGEREAETRKKEEGTVDWFLEVQERRVAITMSAYIYLELCYMLHKCTARCAFIVPKLVPKLIHNSSKITYTCAHVYKLLCINFVPADELNFRYVLRYLNFRLI